MPSAGAAPGCRGAIGQESCRWGRRDARARDSAMGTGRELHTDDVTWEEAERWEGGDEGVGGEQMSESRRWSKRCGEESEWAAVVCF